MKRLFDIVVSLMLLIFATPLLLALILVVRLDSPGPAIFRQVRVGRGERPFVLFKLRTMFVDTDERPSHETPASAVTPLGCRLRRWKLDELPQLWNVLKGDMSFVGPRPCLPFQAALIEARRRRGLAALRPGITGVAQASGIDMSDPERLAEVDALYLERMGFFDDLRVILATMAGAGRGDRVQRGVEADT